MPKEQEHGHCDDGDKSIQRLLVEILNALTDTERRNEQRHIELLAAVRGNDVLAKLKALRSRLEKIAKALATLDSAT